MVLEIFYAPDYPSGVPQRDAVVVNGGTGHKRYFISSSPFWPCGVAATCPQYEWYAIYTGGWVPAGVNYQDLIKSAPKAATVIGATGRRIDHDGFLMSIDRIRDYQPADVVDAPVLVKRSVLSKTAMAYRAAFAKGSPIDLSGSMANAWIVLVSLSSSWRNGSKSGAWVAPFFDAYSSLQGNLIEPSWETNDELIRDIAASMLRIGWKDVSRR